MSKRQKDRIKRVEKANHQVREEFDAVIDESKEVGGEARQDGRPAIDDGVDKLRSRTEG